MFHSFCGWADRLPLWEHTLIGGVLQAGVEEPGFLQIEQARHLVARLIAEGGGLVNGNHAGLTLAGLPAALYADG